MHLRIAPENNLDLHKSEILKPLHAIGVGLRREQTTKTDDGLRTHNRWPKGDYVTHSRNELALLHLAPRKQPLRNALKTTTLQSGE